MQGLEVQQQVQQREVNHFYISTTSKQGNKIMGSQSRLTYQVVVEGNTYDISNLAWKVELQSPYKFTLEDTKLLYSVDNNEYAKDDRIMKVILGHGRIETVNNNFTQSNTKYYDNYDLQYEMNKFESGKDNSISQYKEYDAANASEWQFEDVTSQTAFQEESLIGLGDDNDQDCFAIKDDDDEEQDNDNNNMMIEISPGFYVDYKYQKDNVKAVARGQTNRLNCMECGLDLVCMDEVEFVICPGCNEATPILSDTTNQMMSRRSTRSSACIGLNPTDAAILAATFDDQDSDDDD